MKADLIDRLYSAAKAAAIAYHVTARNHGDPAHSRAWHDCDYSACDDYRAIVTEYERAKTDIIQAAKKALPVYDKTLNEAIDHLAKERRQTHTRMTASSFLDGDQSNQCSCGRTWPCPKEEAPK